MTPKEKERVLFRVSVAAQRFAKEIVEALAEVDPNSEIGKKISAKKEKRRRTVTRIQPDDSQVVVTAEAEGLAEDALRKLGAM